MENKYLKRINELAKKAKETGLTDAETKERDELRQKYLAEFRKGMKKILDSTTVEYPDGTKTELKNLKNRQESTP